MKNVGYREHSPRMGIAQYDQSQIGYARDNIAAIIFVTTICRRSSGNTDMYAFSWIVYFFTLCGCCCFSDDLAESATEAEVCADAGESSIR